MSEQISAPILAQFLHAIPSLQDQHWNENVFILMKSSSLAAPKVVKMTTFGAASDETFIKMMTFSFQWI